MFSGVGFSRSLLLSKASLFSLLFLQINWLKVEGREDKLNSDVPTVLLGQQLNQV